MEENKTVTLMKKIMRINRIHKILIDERIKENGLHRNQHLLLAFLYIKGEPVSQKEIAEKFNISSAAVANSVKKLEQMELICRDTDETDGRYKKLSITQKGMDIIKQNRELFRSADTAMLDGIDDGELDVFMRVIDKMTENLLSLGIVDEQVDYKYNKN